MQGEQQEPKSARVIESINFDQFHEEMSKFLQKYARTPAEAIALVEIYKVKLIGQIQGNWGINAPDR